MLGRWVEKMIRGYKASPEEEGVLGNYLDAVCSKIAQEYQARAKGSDPLELDALDVFAELLMNEMGLKSVELAAARAYLSILIENEHLPTSGQLTASELVSLRDLLFCYFSGSEDVNEKGTQVLSLIEKKFSSGQFAQAKILLQIFIINQFSINPTGIYYINGNAILSKFKCKRFCKTD